MPLTHLIQTAESAISQSRQDDSIVKGTSEPNQVARIVAGLPEMLVNAWGPYVKTGALTVSGVFCHAKPYVSWESPFDATKTERPELADLLIIFDKTADDGMQEERALLLQAKVGKGGEFSISNGGPQVQRYMYATWKPFKVLGVNEEFTQPLIPTDIKSSPDIGTRYVCVDEDRNATSAWMLEDNAATFDESKSANSFKDIPRKTYYAEKSLAAGLVEMYQGVLGRLTKQKDDWSTLIEYLVEFATYQNSATGAKLSNVALQSSVEPVFISKATTFVPYPNSIHTMPFLFPRYWNKQHLFHTVNNWCEPSWIHKGNKNGAYIKWFGPPKENIEINLQEGESGFGIIRIALDAPFSEEKMSR